MRGPHNIIRLIRTGATLERTGAMDVVLAAFKAPKHLRFAAHLLGWPFKWLGLKGDRNLPPATRALTALGPAYIKFGQILSTRPDIVGAELSEQLKYLQDKLPPFPTSIAKAMIEAELDRPLASVFSEFSEPIAAASIAQVHRARLAETGEDVAVKVLRPGIERAFRKDIDAFYLAARVIEILAPFSRRLRPVDVITHFEGVVMDELDLRTESSSAAEFAANTAKDEGFQVPKPYWFLSGRSMMTLGWAEGIGLNDLALIDAGGHDRRVLAARVLQLFLNHALRDGFFHADMHQGNLKIASNGDIIALDFGIMGRIDEYTRRHAAVWPDMLRALKATGWHNYSLFLRDDGLLIGYFETEFLEATRVGMAATEVNARWQAEMGEFFEDLDVGPDEGFLRLREVFNLEDQLAALDEIETIHLDSNDPHREVT